MIAKMMSQTQLSSKRLHKQLPFIHIIASLKDMKVAENVLLLSYYVKPTEMCTRLVEKSEPKNSSHSGEHFLGS